MAQLATDTQSAELGSVIDLGQGGVAAIIEALRNRGFARFDGPCARGELVGLAGALGKIYHHRDSEPDGVTVVASAPGNSGRVGFAGLTDSELILHTDRSGVESPPNFMLLYCERQAPVGGETIVADGMALHRELGMVNPRLLSALTQPGCVAYGGAETLCPASVFTAAPDGSLRLRFRFDHLGFFSAPLVPMLSELWRTLEQITLTFTLSPGQGYIVNNQRWLHGRTQFEGERRMLRLLVEQTPEGSARTAVPPGFSPA